MATVVLIQAQPRLASSGSLIDVRLAGGGSRHYDQLGFSDWRAGIANVPRFSALIGYDKEGLTGGAIPQTGGFRFFSDDGTLNSALANVIWDGARIIVTTGDDEDIVPVYRQRLIGTVASIKADGGAITFTVADLSLDLDKPACPNSFAGTGNLEGVEEATGRVKRRTWGRVFNVEGRLLDKAYNIYEFGDPAFPLSSFDMVKDKGVGGPITVVDAKATPLDTLNALRSAAVPSGGAAVAPSIACVKWWTEPAGPLTADITGPYLPPDRSPAALAQLIVTSSTPSIAVEDRSAAYSWAPYDSGIHCDSATETFGNLLDRLLLPVFIAWVLDGAGVFRFRRVTWDGPVTELRAETISREEVLPAIKGRKLGFQKNHRIHTDGEISAILFTSTDLQYADGTPIEVLKPAEAGANVTEQRTANAIAGQGSLATLSTLDRTGGYLTGFGALSGLSYVKLGDPAPGMAALYTQNLYATSDASVLTALGNALGILGQGLLATLSYVKIGANDGQSTQLLTSNGSSTSDATVLTALGNALGIANQGLLATMSAIGDGYLSGNLATRLAPWGPDARYLNAGAVAFAAGNTIEGLKPGEAGANVTESRNALGFQGQGALATLAFVQFGASRTVVTADGTTVTDQVVVTSVGYAAGFQGQGQLASKNQAGYFDLNIDELRSNTNDSFNYDYRQINPGSSYAPRGNLPSNSDETNTGGLPRLGYDQPIKSGGTIYVTVNGNHSVNGNNGASVFVAFVLLDTADNILATIRLPLGVLTNYLFMIPNTYGTRTIRWRIRAMNNGTAFTQLIGANGGPYVVDVAWKAI